ncbi:MAG: hypothetical protein SNJ29_16355 [Rikenellaceae bacterium]
MQHRALRLLTSLVSVAYINSLRNESHRNDDDRGDDKHRKSDNIGSVCHLCCRFLMFNATLTPIGSE